MNISRRGFLWGAAAAVVAVPLAHSAPLQIIKVLSPPPLDIFNVKDFGAIGDGIVDDLPAINRALVAARRVARGRVFLPPGEYRTTGPIVFGLSENVEIRGCGPESVITAEHIAFEYRE